MSVVCSHTSPHQLIPTFVTCGGEGISLYRLWWTSSLACLKESSQTSTITNFHFTFQHGSMWMKTSLVKPDSWGGGAWLSDTRQKLVSLTDCLHRQTPTVLQHETRWKLVSRRQTPAVCGYARLGRNSCSSGRWRQMYVLLHLGYHHRSLTTLLISFFTLNMAYIPLH